MSNEIEEMVFRTKTGFEETYVVEAADVDILEIAGVDSSEGTRIRHVKSIPSIDIKID